MDTSETYIKMCDCPEIQEQRKPYHRVWSAKHPDKFFDGDIIVADGELLIYGNKPFSCVFLRSAKGRLWLQTGCEWHGSQCNPDKIIWLPRQDQLQEMIDSDPMILHDGFDAWLCGEWGTGYTRLGSPPFTSMEQLWLAFYMSEKHNKCLNGENWVKESEEEI